MIDATKDSGDHGKIAGIDSILSLNIALGKRLCN